MKTRTLQYIVIFWITLSVINYYFVPYFLVVLQFFIMLIGFFAWAFYQIIKTIQEIRALSRQRILSTLAAITLFLCTLYRIPNRLIEKVDWHIYYSRRTKIVELAKIGKLNSNVSWNEWICQLPYEFPIVSNGGNDIGIRRNKSTGKITVSFFVFRNFFSAPSTYFVYTNDPNEIKTINELMENDPDNNWKIDKNWYRTHHE